MTEFKFHDGKTIPATGFGVYLIPIDEATDAVENALTAGYRLIDSAAVYMNEHQSAHGILSFLEKNPHVKRSDIIYGSKIWETDYGYDKAVKAIETSLDNVAGLEYLDYYLIHSTKGGKETRLATYKALQEAVEKGIIRYIGVSNWGVKHLQELYDWPGLKVPPAINQIELNPWLQHQDIVDFCQAKGIVVQAYSPLTVGQRLKDPAVVALAQKYGKTSAQILLRWAIDRGTLPIPKTVTPSRMAENLDVLGWHLDPADLAALGDKNAYYLTAPAWDPTTAQ